MIYAVYDDQGATALTRYGLGYGCVPRTTVRSLPDQNAKNWLYHKALLAYSLASLPTMNFNNSFSIASPGTSP